MPERCVLHSQCLAHHGAAFPLRSIVLTFYTVSGGKRSLCIGFIVSVRNAQLECRIIHRLYEHILASLTVICFSNGLKILFGIYCILLFNSVLLVNELSIFAQVKQSGNVWRDSV